MNLAERFTGHRARYQAMIGERFGLPQYTTELRIRRSTIGQNFTTNVSWTLIQPNPKIENVPDRLVGLDFSNGTIFVKKKDFLVSGIPRSYTENDLRADVDCYVIGGTGPDYLDGIPCRPIYLNINRSLQWTLILSRLKDEPL